MKDLKTLDGRLFEIQKIEKSFLESLRKITNDIAPHVVCSINSDYIELAIPDESGRVAFASEVQVYSRTVRNWGVLRDNRIHYGSSGVFKPINPAPYWRTIHAAAILKNWTSVCEIVNEHCKQYEDLEKEIFEENNLKD